MLCLTASGSTAKACTLGSASDFTPSAPPHPFNSPLISSLSLHQGQVLPLLMESFLPYCVFPFYSLSNVPSFIMGGQVDTTQPDPEKPSSYRKVIHWCFCCDPRTNPEFGVAFGLLERIYLCSFISHQFWHTFTYNLCSHWRCFNSKEFLSSPFKI